MLLVVGAVLLLWPRSLGGATSYVVVSGESMLPTLRPGDLVFLRGDLDYHVGDVVAYHPPAGDIAHDAVVIHRLVGETDGADYLARGDHNTESDPWHVGRGDIIGSTWFTVPRIGGTVARLRSPLPLGIFAGVAGAYLTLTWPPQRARQPGGVARHRATLDGVAGPLGGRGQTRSLTDPP